MKKLRVCIGSNDGVALAESHMGDTMFFCIYDVYENGEKPFIEKRPNIARDMVHAKSEKMKEIIGIVKDADVFVARQNSPNFQNIGRKTKYQPIVIKAHEILGALRIFHHSFQDIDAQVTRRRSGERDPSIPELTEG